MKLRTILLVLSVLAFLSASVGGFLYYHSLRESAFKEADRQAISRLAMIRKNLSGYLSENIKTVQVLAGMEALYRKLLYPQNPETLDQANAILDHFKHALDVEVCYLMDYQGNTVASSNRDAPDSFVGKNFAFRPYFIQAFHKAPATYLALGVTSGKRGVYFSYPVFERDMDLPLGLAVIKAPIENVEKELGLVPEEIVLVTDPHGIIFISNRTDWLFHALSALSPDQVEAVRASRQFGPGPWPEVGLQFDRYGQATDGKGTGYLMHRSALDNYPGWTVIHLQNMDAISKAVYEPLLRITGPIIVSLCIFIGVAVMILYRKASGEILQRKNAEQALRESEEQYRSLYHDTPAMLHSIDASGRLLSVSDYWVEAMGYAREDVIGQPLTRFFTRESKRFAEDEVFPVFFENGFCKDVPYRFVRHDGSVIDILLSAVAVRDGQGEIVRSLAVSVDVTERKRAEEALRRAKEQLSRYSKDLERQVLARTREITNILRYTPDVVYIKDRKGRYLLINACYEALLGKSSQAVAGLSDHDLLPAAVADQFQAHDQQVLSEARSLQIEEHFPHPDGLHTYLSVKFPYYDEKGRIAGVGGISTDITALKKAQNQLRQLSARIIDGQEQERSAIARELHDELGQVLTALRMDVVWMFERVKGKDAKAAERAEAMCRLIDENIEGVRNLAIRLRPGVLDDLGLVDALEWFTADFEKRTGISCVFDHQGIPEVGDTVATAVYRITQEAMTNVGRHAEANHVRVTLAAGNGRLALTVNDDGHGFDTAALSEIKALGVAGMRERAALVGGDLVVRSALGGGTTVTLTVPIKQRFGAVA
jgi:PAS domain S-box-containing protein